MMMMMMIMFYHNAATCFKNSSCKVVVFANVINQI